VRAHFLRFGHSARASLPYEKPIVILNQVRTAYEPSLVRNSIDPATVSVALGLWPVGRNVTPETYSLEPSPRFASRLANASAGGEPYVWIYGERKNIWRDRRAKAYLDTIRRVKESCSTRSP